MAEERKGLSRERVQDLTHKILSQSDADYCRVNVNSGWRGYTRVATNRITSAGGADQVAVQIESIYGKRAASVSTTEIDDASLTAALRESENLARIAPENDEYMPELGPQTYMPVDGYYESTGALTTEARARAAALGIEKAKAAGDFVASGYMDVQAGADAAATSEGLFAFHQGTGVTSTLTVRTPDDQSSGWAGDEAADWTKIESERIAGTAARKAAEWRGRTELEPGAYTAILEPTAVGMLMLRMLGAFSGRTADEGRSYFTKPGGGNRIGESIFDSRVNITSDPAHRDAETAPFNGAGEPLSPTAWVENGTLRNLAYSRYWAEQQDRAPLPFPNNLIMAGGNESVEDMIASTERGVLITRFWYIRFLNPRTISQTGLTRDGTFLIENGKISRPVKNFRFNQSIPEMLQQIDMIGPSTRVAAGENSSVGTPIIVPPLKVRNFNLASVSDAI